MKSFFIRLFMAVAAGIANETGATVEAPLTSPELDKLKAEKKVLWAELIKHEDPDTTEALEAKMNVWKKDGEIKAEIQRLEQVAKDQKIAEQRNQRLALNTAQLAAYDNLAKVKATKGATAVQIAEAQTTFDTAKEAVDNELLAKYAKSTPAKKSSDGATTEDAGDKGAKAKEIVAMYVAGKTHKEIEESDPVRYPRSTVWHAINNYIVKDGGTKLH